MVIPREQRYSTKNGSGLDSLGHFLAFLLLFASNRCCFRRVDFVTAPFLLLSYSIEITLNYFFPIFTVISSFLLFKVFLR